jgi:hypothetical protein
VTRNSDGTEYALKKVHLFSLNLKVKMGNLSEKEKRKRS